ncbi:cytochrome P450 [Cyathus striatus]|nr:cytochrome P450 [Cyathus striatus]
MDFSTIRLRPVLEDLVIFYAFFRFCKWLAKPYIFPSPLRNIPGPAPKSWFMGNLGQLFNAKGLPFHQEIVDRYGGMAKVYGFFGDEQLYISDPRALHNIIIKDQDSFEETAVFTETNKVIFGPGLLKIGEQHKRQRKAVTPVFSVSQLRLLTPVLDDIATKLCDVLERETQHANVLDMSEWMCRVALETVGQTVLGYSFDPLDSPHNNPYTSAIKELIPTLFQLALVRQFAPFLSKLGPAWLRRKLVEWTPSRPVQRVKEMSDVMHETAVNILNAKRERVNLEDESVKGDNDVISVLLRENQHRGVDALSDNELTGQMTVLIFGAQDTTSSALSRILFLLASRPDIQRKLRDEVHQAKGMWKEKNGGYDEVMKLPWLDAVVKETLRLYPPVPFVRRTTTKTTTLPYALPTDYPLPTSSSPEVGSVLVPKGTTLFVSIAGANRLESVWGDDAKVWRPERWIEESGGHGERSKDGGPRLPGVYSGMMSFLGGGRSCVGYKFAQVEMKIILISLLSRFEFAHTGEEIVWNLSQIISPSVKDGEGEKKGMPLFIKRISDSDS